MKYILPLLLTLGACQAPSYFEVHAGATEGEQHFNRSFGGIDEETYYLGVTIGWNLGITHMAMRNMASLDINRAGELNTQDKHTDPGGVAPITVNVEGDEAEEAAPVAEEGDGIIDAILEKPKPGEELGWLVWVFGVCAALYILHLLGVLPKRKP